jgi:uncharacterized cupredoxin-like copper-binding protein
MHRRHRNAATTAALALSTLLVTACGGDDTPAADAATPATVKVTMVDYAYKDLPKAIDAGTRLEVVNESKKELHELVAFLLPESEKRSAAELMKLPEAEIGALLQGEPAAVLLQAPGGPQVAAVGDGTLTEKGRYLVLCAIPTGAVPQEYLDAAAKSEGGPPQGVAGGPPHFTAGMFGELTVN